MAAADGGDTELAALRERVVASGGPAGASKTLATEWLTFVDAPLPSFGRDAAGKLVNLGDCYRNGHGVKKDAHAAVVWYRRAAEAGNAYAQNSLGDCYRDGMGVEKDARVAVGWYRRAAEAEEMHAQNSLVPATQKVTVSRKTRALRSHGTAARR